MILLTIHYDILYGKYQENSRPLATSKIKKKEMVLKEKFSANCQQYENFEVWDIENMNSFFKGNEIIQTIFEDTYGFPVGEFNEKRSEIPDTNGGVIEAMLDHVGDKSFHIFTLHDENHLDLVSMQNMKIMDFGVDIEDIQKDHFYVLIMDKKAGM